jgi:peptide/nickel transport system permease protein
LGTDNLGRCIASRLLYGARASLSYAMIVLGAMLAISIPIGLLAGYVGGKVDALIMRIIDTCLAFPSSLLALAVAGMLGASARNLLIAMACVWWCGYARVVRGLVLQIKGQDYILAAQAAGCSRQRIVFHHILRYGFAIIVLSTLEVCTYSGYRRVSFIGLGAQPPAPSGCAAQ